MNMKIDSALADRLRRFRDNKRGFYALLFISSLIVCSMLLNLLINSRALVVYYQQDYYFPVFKGFYNQETFGLEGGYEANYRELSEVFKQQGEGNWVLMPLIPYNPYESDFRGGSPAAPNFELKHYLGTDTLGRDVASRLFYAFRTTIFFSLALYLLNTALGLLAGSTMAYFGGWFDLLFQRFVEIWANLPVLYILIILGAFITPNIYLLLFIFALLNWTGISWLIRAEVLREKQLKYTQAAISIGASHLRVIVVHLLPNSIVPIIANFPFQMIVGIGLLTSLDYLGYGLPIPTPSWGELIQQGQKTFEFAPWIILSPVVALVVTLLSFSFIGEALRDALDPQKNIRYS